jgi:hypothetical protein
LIVSFGEIYYLIFPPIALQPTLVSLLDSYQPILRLL